MPSHWDKFIGGGYGRLIKSEAYRKKKQEEIADAVWAKHQAQYARAPRRQRFAIRSKIRKDIREELIKVAPPWGLYFLP